MISSEVRASSAMVSCMDVSHGSAQPRHSAQTGITSLWSSKAAERQPLPMTKNPRDLPMVRSLQFSAVPQATGSRVIQRREDFSNLDLLLAGGLRFQNSVAHFYDIRFPHRRGRLHSVCCKLCRHGWDGMLFALANSSAFGFG